MTQDKYLRIEDVGMTFGAFDAITGVSLTVRRGEFVSLIGHSGCGKSTLLNLVAGLLRPSAGALILAEREIAGPGPDRGVVFQNHSLLPWLTCFENVHLAVERVFKERKENLRTRTHAALELVGLSHAAQKYPHEISGGMKQRVGIARAFAIEPKMLLLDEPFGALDALTRGVIQDELLKICAATHQTVFMITHDVDEAILLADKIMLMSNGPRARIAEIVVNTLPRDRSRHTIHKDPQYYPIRNHLVDFLVSRSKGFTEQPPADYDPRHPPLVTPGLAAAASQVFASPAQPRAAPAPNVVNFRH